MLLVTATGGAVAVFGQQLQHRFGQSGVAAVELTGVLRAVDARQVHDESCPAAVAGQGLQGIVFLEQQQVPAAQGAQGSHQVAAHEPACAGDENGGGQGGVRHSAFLASSSLI